MANYSLLTVFGVLQTTLKISLLRFFYDQIALLSESVHSAMAVSTSMDFTPMCTAFRFISTIRRTVSSRVQTVKSNLPVGLSDHTTLLHQPRKTHYILHLSRKKLVGIFMQHLVFICIITRLKQVIVIPEKLRLAGAPR